MPRSKSSKQWLQEHFSDIYVKKSKDAGYRSRAVYKLLDMQEKYKLIKKGMTVVDLGAAPGGWSQLAVELVGDTGQVYALDILPMEPLPHVNFIQGDFRELSVLDHLLKSLGNHQADLVMSDMAPNISGIKHVDQPRSLYLAELALDTAKRILKPSGGFVVKVFQGEGFDAYVKEIKSAFRQATIRKPPASRSRSREVYVIASGYRGSNIQ